MLTNFFQGKSYPFITMDDILFQVPSLKKKFFKYNSYADAFIADVIPSDKLSAIKPLQAVIFNTVYLENTGKGLVKKDLPVEAQYAPVFAMCSADVNADGNMDLLMFGNNRYNRMKLAQYDANFGQVYLGNGKGNFIYLPQNQSGLSLKGDVRGVQFINDNLLIAINNQPVQTYRLKKK